MRSAYVAPRRVRVAYRSRALLLSCHAATRYARFDISRRGIAIFLSFFFLSFFSLFLFFGKEEGTRVRTAIGRVVQRVHTHCWLMVDKVRRPTTSRGRPYPRTIDRADSLLPFFPNRWIYYINEGRFIFHLSPIFFFSASINVWFDELSVELYAKWKYVKQDYTHVTNIDNRNSMWSIFLLTSISYLHTYGY